MLGQTPLTTSAYPNRRQGTWPRVTRQAPCPICNRPDYCGVSADGRAAICMRVASGHATKNGGWLHWLGDRPRSGPRSLPPTRAALAPGSVAALAPVERRDAVYRALAVELGLSPAHRQHLRTVRGLSAATLDAAPWATLPALPGLRRQTLAESVWRRLGKDPAVLAGVPGFAATSVGWTLTGAPAGFLVPVLDAAGRCLAYQLRADTPRPVQPRYTWLSSSGRDGGASSGTPVAVWRPGQAARATLITEGSLKAASTADHFPGCACVVAVAGVGCWREVPGTLAGLLPRGGAVTVAYDADAATNPAVLGHREALCLALVAAGYRVQVATWDGARAKGVDDCLLAGLAVDVQPWRRTLAPPIRPRGVPLPPVGRPVGVPLASLPTLAPVAPVEVLQWPR